MTQNPNADSEQTRRAGALLMQEIADVTVCFRWAPAGTFLMGSPEDEEGRVNNETQHEVTLTQGFWIADVPTTIEFWRAVMFDNQAVGFVNLFCFEDSE